MNNELPSYAYDSEFYREMPGLKFPEPPADAIYTPECLELFPRHSRETYRTTTGSQAPPFDPAKPVKNWFCPVLPQSGVFRYLYIDGRDRQAPVKIAEIPASEAAQVNLPGRPEFAPYEVAPTPAVVVGGAEGYSLPINPLELATPEQAKELAGELGADEIEVSFLDGPVFSTEWRGETRRPYYLKINGNWYNAGRLLEMKNRAGVGHPGSWEFIGGQPYWAAAVLPDGSEKDYEQLPAPVRPLKPFEKIQISLFGPHLIVRTDKENQLNPTPGASAGPEPASLSEMLEILRQMKDQVGDMHRLLMLVRPQAQ